MGKFEFKLPDIGEGVVEGEIVEWMVAVGDTVKEDDPILSVMTDKATVEIPAPVDGRIVSLNGAVGQMTPVGTVRARSRTPSRSATRTGGASVVAANAIGDDAIQGRMRGKVVPHTFTHGTSAQRIEWFKRGFQSGDVDSCDTRAWQGKAC